MSCARAIALSVLFGACLAACGAAGGPDGGGSNLPNRGIGPWEERLEDFLLAPSTGRYASPSGLRADGGILLAFHREAAGALDVLITALGPDGDDATGAPSVLLAGASQPALARGPDGRIWMSWVDAESGGIHVGHLDAAREGIETAYATELTGSSPAIAVDGEGTLHLFYVADDAVFSTKGPPDGPLAPAEIILEPGQGCLDDDGEPEDCWDATAIVDIDVRIATTATGRAVWRMFYTGRRGTAHRFGFAASFDGRLWERYAYNPVLNAGNNGRAPTVVQAEDRYLLYYEDRTARGVVGRVLIPSAVSETW